MPWLADKIAAAVDARREALISTLCDLVRINTVNRHSGGRIVGNERDGQRYLAPRLTALGADVALVPVPADVYERAGVIGPTDRDFSDRPNLVATCDFRASGPHVLVFAHMDTVAADDMAAPFDPVRLDGRITGRGASDDKSGLAAMVIAAEVLHELKLPLAGRLTLASVVEEECSGGGAGILAVLLAGCRPDVAVCLDGAGGLVGVGCAGVITGRIDVPGVAAHAASPRGVSALEKALIVKRTLDEFKARRLACRPNGLLNLGVFRAGVHASMVPGDATMEFNVVYFPDEAAASQRAGLGLSAALLRREIEAAVARAADGDAFLASHRPRLTWIKDLPPFETPVSSPLVAAVTSAYTDATGAAAPTDVMNGWSDAAHVPLLAGCEVVNLGSSAPGAAHAPDEYVEEEMLVRTAKALTLYLARILERRDDRPV